MIGKKILFFALIGLNTLLQATSILSPEKAFDFTWHKDKNIYTVEWHTAPHYRLYLHSIRATEDHQPIPIHWLTPRATNHPKGQVYATHANSEITITYQGCHQEGLCLPPQETTIQTPSTQKRLFEAFILGLLLSLTPCLLPMWPIFVASLNHMATNHKKHPVTLAGAFIAGIIISYNGLALALYVLQAPIMSWIQNPWVLSVAALLLTYLGLSMLDILPQKLAFSTTKHTSLPTYKKYPHLQMLALGAGGLLVLSPCLTPPLLAAMTYLPTLQNIWVPASCMALGMTLPFLGLALGQKWHMTYLRKIAPISQKILGLFVVLTALIVLLRILSMQWIPWAWLSYCIITLITLTHSWKTMKKQALWLLIPLIIVLPSTWHAWQTPKQNNTPTIASLQALEHLRLENTHKQRPTIIMVSASWCSTCKIVKKNLIQALKKYPTWRYAIIDVSYPPKTAETALIDAWSLRSPPMLLWFDTKGEPLPNQTLFGNASAAKMEEILLSIEKSH